MLTGGSSRGPIAFMLFLAILLFVAYAFQTADQRQQRWRCGSLHDRICACSYDLRGSPDSGICPECAVDYTPDSLREHWKAAVRELWPPIGERRMWRALTWWQLAMVAAAPASFFIARSFAPRLGGLVVLVAIAAAVGLMLYITRGQVFEWRALTRRNFRSCPCCLRSLADLSESGDCPRCKLAYTPEQLRLTWSVIYRRTSAPAPQGS